MRSKYPFFKTNRRRSLCNLTFSDFIPRQSGKTTLSKMLVQDFDYLNFDSPEHRLRLLERIWDRKKEAVIFDELHKLKNWKSWLKGVYDTEGIPPALMVTGSAKLDTYKKSG